MRESIFWASIRAFFIALFVFLGFFLGLVILIMGLASLSDKASEPERIYTQEVVANAQDKRAAFSTSKPVILQVNITGVIGVDTLTAEAIQRQLMESREGNLKDTPVKAILLHIDSPGGSANDSATIYHALKRYKENYKVPIYAYTNGICASGGMFVACAADKIFASENGLIGSIGVISPAFFNFTQLMEKIGVQSLTLYAGKAKDELNPLRPWKPGEGDIIQGLINYYYEQFVNIVMANRSNINREKLIADYGAKIFNPREAHEIGFIDGWGYQRGEVIKKLLEELKITDDQYQVVELQKRTWLSELYSASYGLLQGKIVHKIELLPGFDIKLLNQFLYLYTSDCALLAN